MRTRLFVLYCLFLLIFLVGCGNTTASEENSETGNEEYTLTLAHGFPTNHFMHTFMEWFDEEIQARSEGQLSLEIYPNAQLMSMDQQTPAQLQGQIDMSHLASPVLAGFDERWNFFELPFLFDYDPEDPTVFLENRTTFLESEEGGGEFKRFMEEKGIKVLSLGYIDIFGSIFTTDKLVTDVESARGLRIRTPGGIVSPETMASVGVNGITMAGTEVITALQQGVVDGLLTTPIYAHDVNLPINTYTVVPLFNSVTAVTISVDKFESLPAHLQEILVETGSDLEKHIHGVIQDSITETLPKLENEKGVDIYYPTEEEIEEWREATRPAWELFEKEVEGGKELLETLSQMNE